MQQVILPFASFIYMSSKAQFTLDTARYDTLLRDTTACVTSKACFPCNRYCRESVRGKSGTCRKIFWIPQGTGELAAHRRLRIAWNKGTKPVTRSSLVFLHV